MVLKCVIGVHLLMEYIRVIKPGGEEVPKVLFRHFAIMNYCNVRRNYQEEVDNLERRPSYAALGILGTNLSHHFFRLYLEEIEKIQNFV